MDSPVLYLASHQAIDLNNRDIDNLRRFVEAGGLIFTQADGGSPTFNRFVVELGQKLFPMYEFADLPQDHELYTLHYRIRSPAKAALPGQWFAHLSAALAAGHHLGLASLCREDPSEHVRAGREHLHLRRRQDGPAQPAGFDVPSAAASASRGVSVAAGAAAYAGQWDPEPAAYPRFSRWFEYRTGYALDIAAAQLEDLRAGGLSDRLADGHGAIHADRRAVRCDPQVCAGRRSATARCLRRIGIIQPMRDEHDPAQGVSRRQSRSAATGAPDLRERGERMEFLSRPLIRTFAEQKLGRDVGLRMLLGGVA